MLSVNLTRHLQVPTMAFIACTLGTPVCQYVLCLTWPSPIALAAILKFLFFTYLKGFITAEPNPRALSRTAVVTGETIECNRGRSQRKIKMMKATEVAPPVIANSPQKLQKLRLWCSSLTEADFEQL